MIYSFGHWVNFILWCSREKTPYNRIVVFSGVWKKEKRWSGGEKLSYIAQTSIQNYNGINVTDDNTVMKNCWLVNSYISSFCCPIYKKITKWFFLTLKLMVMTMPIMQHNNRIFLFQWQTSIPILLTDLKYRTKYLYRLVFKYFWSQIPNPNKFKEIKKGHSFMDKLFWSNKTFVTSFK